MICKNLEVVLAEKDKALMMLSALPNSYEYLTDALIFGREKSLTLDEVQAVLRQKDEQKTAEGKGMHTGEGLTVRYKKSFHEKKKEKWQNKSQTKAREKQNTEEKRKCFNCKKPRHLKKHCPLLRGKQVGQHHYHNTADIV